MALIDPLELQGAALHGCSGSRMVEKAAQAPLPQSTLMRRAGRAAARLVLALPDARGHGPIIVVTGSGHNGGDGWAAARELKQARRSVLVWEPLGCSAPEALQLRTQALEAHVHLTGISPAIHGEEALVDQVPVPEMGELRVPDEALRPALVIDALLGLGAKGTLRPHVVAAIEWMQSQSAAGVPILSLDLPSGICADTGILLTDDKGQAHAVRADHTLSLLTLKPGLFTAQGREHAGRLWFDDLDSAPTAAQVPAQARLATGRTFSGLLRSSRTDAQGRWRHDGHKGSHGDAWIVGGAPGMAGAAVLAARAALRAGAGRVHLHRLDGAVGDDGMPEIMGVAAETQTLPLRGQPCTVVAGCGGSARIAPLLPALMHDATRLVLDADALNALAADAALQQRLKARWARARATIITPHPLEAARLLGCSTAEVQADRCTAARELAERLACTVVLKGSGTVTATPGQTPWINASGNARLSTAGTGDVLAGWIGGAWSALAHEPASGGEDACGLALAHRVATAAVELHGLSASAAAQARDGHDPALLTAGDLIERMRALL